MSVGAIVKDGQIQETASQSSVQKASGNNGMDKDAFLQLLVAQMKYQDPLEPTSNTEYISQYATFSQVEQMQNMAASMELSRASSMVGKLVNVETTNSNGETKQIQGMVEYVTYENNKAYVSIDGTLYSTDDVVAVVDEVYQDAYDLAITFAGAMEELPLFEELTLSDKEAVSVLQQGYNSMTAYQQSFISKADVEKLQQYVARIAQLEAEAEENNETEETDGTEEAEKSEAVEETEGAEEAAAEEGAQTEA